LDDGILAGKGRKERILSAINKAAEGARSIFLLKKLMNKMNIK